MHRKTPAPDSVFNKVAGQVWLVHNMSLKAYKLNQGATEMFISKFENKVCTI